MSDVKMHWFAFSFRWLSPTGEKVANTYEGFDNQSVLINKPIIESARVNSGMPDNAVLVAVCYLGRGTIAEFKGE